MTSLTNCSNHSSLEQWKTWNYLGFIPGDVEKEAMFQRRIAFCLSLKNHLQAIPSIASLTSSTPVTLLENESLQITDNLYGIKPSWIPIIVSDVELSPWHGGCAWFFTHNECPGVILQLSSRFNKKGNLCHLYSSEEICAHEITHAGRIMEEQDDFEEIFAYQTSPSSFRKWLGPIIQSSHEVYIFLTLLLLTLSADVSVLLFPDFQTLSLWTTVTKIFPVLYGLWLFFRLMYKKKIWARALENLKKLPLNGPATHLHYRLTSSEIQAFSRMTPEQILAYMQDQKKHSFRWKFLYSLYL